MKSSPFPSADRVLVGAFAALVVARPLVDAADPGRLRLTTAGGPLSFNLMVFVLLGLVAVRRAVFGGPRLGWSAVVPLLLLGVAAMALFGVLQPDRYARPGLFIAWEWAALAAAFVTARLLARSPEDGRGILNVFVASAVSIAGLGIYQGSAELTGLPPTDPVVPASSFLLAGDDEFRGELNRPPASASTTHGTLDTPDTLLALLGLACVVAWPLASAKRPPTRRWPGTVLRLTLLAGVLVAIAAVANARRSEPTVTPGTALSVFWEHPAVGTGAGNWSRFAADPSTSPAAWALLVGTMGLTGGLLFAAAIAVPAWRIWKSPDTAMPDGRTGGSRWEFHLGGIAGLVLGFVWVAGSHPPEAPTSEIFRLATIALFRAALWIAAFTVLESGRTLLTSRSLVRGVVLVVLIGFAFAGPSRFTILFPVFVLLGLALNARNGSDGEARVRPAAIGSVGLVVGAWTLAIGHLVTAAVPGWATASAVREARLASRHYPDLARQIEQARDGGPQTTARTKTRDYLVAHILRPLRDAAVRDPQNAGLLLEIARWERYLWRVQLYLDGPAASRLAFESLDAADRAAKLDPRNTAGLWSKFESLLVYRRLSDRMPDDRLNDLGQVIAEIAAREPAAEVGMRYRLADLLISRREIVAAKAEVETVLRLDDIEGSPHGRLTDAQRTELIARASRLIPIPPKDPKKKK